MCSCETFGVKIEKLCDTFRFIGENLFTCVRMCSVLTLYDIQCLSVKCFSRQKMYLTVCIHNKRIPSKDRKQEIPEIPQNFRNITYVWHCDSRNEAKNKTKQFSEHHASLYTYSVSK